MTKNYQRLSINQTKLVALEGEMGSARPRPKRLASKLLQIRQRLGLSQSGLVRRLGIQNQIQYPNISKYELDKNEPPLDILLAYAKAAGVPVEVLIDDELELTQTERLAEASLSDSSLLS